MNRDATPAHFDVVLLQLRQIHSRDHLSMCYEQQAIARKEIGQDGIFATCTHHLVRGIADGFEPLQSSNLANDRRLIDADMSLAAVEYATEFMHADQAERPHPERQRHQHQECPAEKPKYPCCGGRALFDARRLRIRSCHEVRCYYRGLVAISTVVRAT